MDGGDDADRERRLVAEGAADRRDGLADDDAGRAAERDRREPVAARVDLQQPDVVEDVPADDLGRDAVVVGELDVHLVGAPHVLGLAGVRDHVRVGEDVAGAGDDEAGALARVGIRHGGAAEVAEDRHDAGCARGVEARRREGAPRKRSGRRADDHARRAGVRGRGRDDHGCPSARPDPVDGTADPQCGRTPEQGRDDGDGGDRARAHEGEL